MDVQADAASKAGTSPQDEAREAFAFAGLVFDLDACTLKRESGEVIALTRGEFALLREFVRRAGRVLSRDFLLDAAVGRRNAPFDRSVDVMVGRLRKKVEPDPKQPSVIQTVPGEGYRFTAPLRRCEPAAETVAATAAAPPGDTAIPPPAAVPWTWRALWPVLAAAVALCVIAAVAAVQWRPTLQEAGPRFSMVVLPFANLTGEPGWDYLGKDMGVELTTVMGAFPNMHVVAGSSQGAADQDIRRAAAQAGARYVLAGALDKVNDRLRYTAQLFDGASGHELWSARYDDEGVDPKAPGPDIATRIYDALAGLEGRLYAEEERRSWSKDEASLDGYDYYLRGASLFLRFTPEDNEKALTVFAEGLKKYPNEALLQVKLAWCFLMRVEYQVSKDTRGDIERAWAQAQSAKAAPSQSHLATYLLHQLMASLYQYHDGDFPHSIDEAKAAMSMAPYETLSRADLSGELANAGDAREAIIWAERAVTNAPNPPPWYYANLGLAYYVGHRYDDALKAVSRYKADFPALYTAICVRLGRLDEARAAIADALKAGTKVSIANEGSTPQIEPQRTAYLNDLRTAGVPEGEVKKDDGLAAAPRLSIVVLPFENMSGDKEQDYFADGITDDLTTDLSHLQDSFVISRGTAFTYKGKPVDAKEIGRELGVRYVLEGSVRRLGEKVEVNAQLISTETGAHVWADRFEGEHSKLGELQLEVVSRLARSLNVELIKAEALRATRERPNNPDAADLAMRASARFNSNADSSKSVNSDVIDLDERALALDPQNERAMADLAMAVDDRVTMRWSEDPAGDLARADKLADSALALQPNDARAHMAKAEVSFNKQQWTAAITQGEAALADDANYALARAEPSFWNIFLGHAEDSFAGIDTALRLSPRDPDASWWQWFRCHAHTHLAQWEQAIEWCGKSIANGNQSFFPFVDLAAADAWAGHDKEAKDAAAQLQKVYPGFTVQTWAGMHWSDDPTFNAQYQRIVEGLRKAGLPEGDKKPN